MTELAGVRISGLASGMDIDSIVKDLMKVERLPLDKMEKEKTQLEWKRDSYREMNTALFSFDGELLNYTLSGTYGTRSVTSTNEAKITATAASGAGKGTYTFSEISQLAKAATLVNNEKISNGKVDVTKSLYSLYKDGTLDITENTWKPHAGSVESRTLRVDETMEINGMIDLKLGEGRKLLNTSGEGADFTTDIVIKVNGERIDLSDIEINDSGQINLLGKIKKGDTVEIDYVANKKISNAVITKSTTQINIGAGLAEDGFAVKIKDENGEDISLEIDGENILYNGTNIGTINYDEGVIYLTEENVNDNERIPKLYSLLGKEKDTSINITIESKQKYFTFDLETHTSKGHIQETFFVKASDSLNQVIRQVNDSDLGLMMYFDEQSNQMSLTRTETGKFNHVKYDEHGNITEAYSDIIIKDDF